MSALCFLCSAPGVLCPDCSLVSSCSLHTHLHKDDNYCFPFNIANVEGKGNCMVASRDISPLEVILVDGPLGVAPIQDSLPVCLQCFKKLDVGFQCPGCDAPMCGEVCSRGDKHREECKIFQLAGLKLGVCDFDSQVPWYQWVMYLRLLILIEKDPVARSRIDLMMDHEEDRRVEKANWDFMQKNVVETIRGRLGQDQWGEELIQRLAGVVRTNGFQLHATGVQPGEEPLEDHELGISRVLFPTVAFINHSCLPNTRVVHKLGYHLGVRSKVHIKAGEEITISYNSAFMGVIDRREDFNRTWFFDCSCVRCSSATDLDTHSDSLLCPSCPSGLLQQSQPLSYKAPWTCETCKNSMLRQMVKEKEQELEKKSEEAGDDTDKLEQLLTEYKKVFHPNHHLFLKMKLKLTQLYGNSGGQTQMNRKYLEKKIEVCTEVLSILAQVDPGFSDNFGMVLYERIPPSLLVLQQQLDTGEIGVEAFKEGLTNIIEDGQQVKLCMEFHDQGTNRKEIDKKVDIILRNTKDLLMFADFL